jgi:multiple antibiotic resistance protein
LPDLELNGRLFAEVFVTVLVITDPLGCVPVFLALTRNQSPEQRRRSAWQASAVAGGVILGFAFLGRQILDVLGISLESLQVAGGLLLLLVALELLRGNEDGTLAAPGANVALVPLGTPLLAGPGAIAATMLAMERADSVGGTVSVVAALVAALVLVWATLRWSSLLDRVLKENGISLLTRVMGLLVAAIAVQLIADAIEEWVRNGVS